MTSHANRREAIPAHARLLGGAPPEPLSGRRLLIARDRVDARRSIEPEPYPPRVHRLWKALPTNGTNHLLSQARPRVAQLSSNVATCAYSSLEEAA